MSENELSDRIFGLVKTCKGRQICESYAVTSNEAIGYVYLRLAGKTANQPSRLRGMVLPE